MNQYANAIKTRIAGYASFAVGSTDQSSALRCVVCLHPHPYLFLLQLHSRVQPSNKATKHKPTRLLLPAGIPSTILPDFRARIVHLLYLTARLRRHNTSSLWVSTRRTPNGRVISMAVDQVLSGERMSLPRCFAMAQEAVHSSDGPSMQVLAYGLDGTCTRTLHLLLDFV